MVYTTDYKIVTKQDFLSEVAPLKVVLHGYGKRVASEAGVDYWQYRNALNGRIKNPALLGGILRACKIVYNDIIQQYSEPGKS